MGGWCQTLQASLGLMIASDRNVNRFCHVCFCHFVTKRCFKHLSNGMNPGNCLKMPKLIEDSMPKLAEMITRNKLSLNSMDFK